MSAQFGTFDNLADRRELYYLFEKLGEGLDEEDARKVRAQFLQDLIPHSVSEFAGKPMFVNPDQCAPLHAYLLFGQICGILGVPIDDGARRLEAVIRRQEWMRDRSRAYIARVDVTAEEFAKHHDRRALVLGS